MNKKLVHENKAFNSPVEDLPFYFQSMYRKIHKSGPPSIYHYHDKIELIFCEKGKLEITLFTNSIVLSEGDFIFISPNTPHATTSSTEYNEHYCIKFDKQILHVPSSRQLPPESYFISLLNEYEVFHTGKNKEIHNFFRSSHENFSHDDYFKRLTLTANIMLIMSYVFKNSSALSSNKSATKISNNFLHILDYIEEKGTTLTLEEAAKYCSMSYSYFSRNFKSEFGVSFTNYILKKRIERSIELLSNSDRNLNEIALECGFSNLSHYIKCFNAEKGITPKKFRMITAKKQ